MEISPSARKHGVDDADIEYAYAHYLYIADLASDGDDRRVLYLGPDRSANLLELVVVQRDDDDDLVIHAMRMSRRYEGLVQ